MNAQTEEFLEHFGVLGMQWGIRKAVSKGGLGRRDAAKIELNNRRITLSKNIRDRKAGPVWNTVSALDKVLMGKKRFEKFHNTQITKVKEQNTRIRLGEKTIRDKFDSALNLPLANVYIVRKK